MCFGSESIGFVWAEWDNAYSVYAVFSLFCYVCVFSDFSDSLLATLRDATGDVVLVYACSDTKGHFFAASSIA